MLDLVAISYSRDLPHLRIEPTSPEFSVLAGALFTTEPPGKPQKEILGAINSYSLKQTKEISSYSQDEVIWTRFTLTLETTKHKQNQLKNKPNIRNNDFQNTEH